MADSLALRPPCEVCGGPVDVEAPHCGCLDLIGEFSNAMIGELAANARKGGRRGPRGWKAQDYRVLVSEVLYHAAKLSYAARQFDQGDGDPERIREFAADTANMAMMVADSLGAFDTTVLERRDDHG